MIVRMAGGFDEEQIVREVRRALHDPDVDSIVLHKPGSSALTSHGEELIVDAGGHWRSRSAVPQADGCGR